MSENKSNMAEKSGGQKKNTTLEDSFYKLGLEKKIRQTFRVPIDETDNVKVIIDNIDYEVIDIASTGIGIKITKLDKFNIGQVLTPLRVIINDQTFRLEGEIIHITPTGQDISLCGIKFRNMTDKIRDTLLDYLQKYGSFDMEVVY